MARELREILEITKDQISTAEYQTVHVPKILVHVQLKINHKMRAKFNSATNYHNL